MSAKMTGNITKRLRGRMGLKGHRNKEKGKSRQKYENEFASIKKL